MGTFGNPGNGDYRGDLLRAAAVITEYVTSHHIPLHQAILRLDGQYGDYAVVADWGQSGLSGGSVGRHGVSLNVIFVISGSMFGPRPQRTKGFLVKEPTMGRGARGKTYASRERRGVYTGRIPICCGQPITNREIHALPMLGLDGCVDNSDSI
jgi:hypothetical protein